MTVDEIYEATFAQLEAAERGVVARMDAYMASIAAARSQIAEAKAKFNLRPHTTASINTKQIREVKFTICTRGVTSGFLRLNVEGEPQFSNAKVNTAFAALDRSLTSWTSWRDARVRAYLDSCARVADVRFSNREQSVQATLLDVMFGRKVKRKTQLRHFQPVELGGVPIQLPTPVRPRGKVNTPSPGHLDILARHGGGNLAVLELKRPQRGAGVGALAQAVTYAAGMQWLMNRDEARPLYWKAFGSRRSAHRPKFHAYAVVLGVDGDALRREWEQLDARNSQNVGLGVMVYSRVGNDLVVEALPRER